MDDQARFAALSGDFNPIHVDPLAARRLPFGTPVAHGMHLVMWALESCAPAGGGPQALSGVTAVFRQPVRVGEETVCEPDASCAAARITSQGRLAAEIAFRIGSAEATAREPGLPLPQEGLPATLDFEEARDAEGEIPLVYAPALTASVFPRVAAAFPPRQLAVLLGVSRLAGMECPGLRSLLSSLKLDFSAAEEPAAMLGYRVVKADPRMRSLRMQLSAPGLAGELVALLRPDPVEQPALSALAGLVTRGEFAGVRALVVGGSRGLGEVAAKLVAAGGGDVRLTYQVGAVEAARVVAEIRGASGRAAAFACDVLSRQADPALLDGWAPTHLFYFPTPYISLNESTGFSAELFRLYCRYYVEGFAWALDTASAAAPRGLRVFYPSSAVLDAPLPKAGEYAAAKAAGEAVCAQLRAARPGLRVHAPRLPRVLTDRTSSVLPVETAEAGPLLLREMRRLDAV